MPVSHHTALELARLAPLYLHLAACLLVICFELKRNVVAGSRLAEADRLWKKLTRDA